MSEKNISDFKSFIQKMIKYMENAENQSEKHRKEMEKERNDFIQHIDLLISDENYSKHLDELKKIKKDLLNL